MVPSETTEPLESMARPSTVTRDVGQSQAFLGKAQSTGNSPKECWRRTQQQAGELSTAIAAANGFHARISVNNLPVDILLEVFSLITFKYEGSKKKVSKSSLYNLIQVCRHWMDIASDHSLFWEDIKIQTTASKFDTTRLDSIKKVLQRSRDLSLTLKIGIPYAKVQIVNGKYSPTQNPSLTEPRFLSQLLEPVRDRLRSIVISGIPLSDILSLEVGRLNNLERLVLDTSPTIMEQHQRKLLKAKRTTPKCSKAFEDSPCLRRVAVTNQYILRKLLDIPLGNLTHLLEVQRVEKPGAKDFVFTGLAKECTNLTHLATTISPGREYAGQFSGEPYTLKSLRYLTVNGLALPEFSTVWEDLDEIFKRFKMPNLISLRVVCKSLWEGFTFTPRLAEALAGLEYLSLNCQLHGGGEENILSLTPRLRTLDLHYASIDDNCLTLLLKKLAEKGGNEHKHHLVPLLDTLVIDVSVFLEGLDSPYEREFNGGKFRVFLQSRTEGRTKSGVISPFRVIIYAPDALGRACVPPRWDPEDGVFQGFDKNWRGVLHEFSSEGKLALEVRVIEERVKLRSHKKSMQSCHAGQGWWLYRAPELEDWPECREIIKGLTQ